MALAIQNLDSDSYTIFWVFTQVANVPFSEPLTFSFLTIRLLTSQCFEF